MVSFGVGYGRGSSVSMMGFPSASLSARSRVPPSKSQPDRMRSKASFEGPYVGVMVGWNAGDRVWRLDLTCYLCFLPPFLGAHTTSERLLLPKNQTMLKL